MGKMKNLIRVILVLAGIIFLWQTIIWVTGVPDYILPGPTDVLAAFETHYDTLAKNSMITFAEIIAGLDHWYNAWRNKRSHYDSMEAH